jgi:hypothetical protein
MDPERVCKIHFDQIVAVSHYCTLRTRSLRRNQPSSLETWILVKCFLTPTLIATAVKGSATIHKRVKASWKIWIQHLTMMAGSMNTIRQSSKTSSDDQTLTVADDVYLDAPQLLDLLSDKPTAGGLKAPLEKEATVPLPSSGPVEWAFNLPVAQIC